MISFVGSRCICLVNALPSYILSASWRRTSGREYFSNAKRTTATLVSEGSQISVMALKWESSTSSHNFNDAHTRRNTKLLLLLKCENVEVSKKSCHQNNVKQPFCAVLLIRDNGPAPKSDAPILKKKKKTYLPETMILGKNFEITFTTFLCSLRRIFNWVKILQMVRDF